MSASIYKHHFLRYRTTPKLIDLVMAKASRCLDLIVYGSVFLNVHMRYRQRLCVLKPAAKTTPKRPMARARGSFCTVLPEVSLRPYPTKPKAEWDMALDSI